MVNSIISLFSLNHQRGRRSRIARRSQVSMSSCLVDTLESRRLLTNVSGHITSNQVWSNTTEPYIITGSLYVDAGVTLTVSPGVTIRTDNSLYDIHVRGTLDVTGATLSGTQTEVIVASGGRLNLKSGSAVDGAEVRYRSGSLGTVDSSTFGTARLRLESSAVAVDGCTFTRVDPISTNPSLMPQLFDNVFLNDATVWLSGTALSNATFHKIANLSRYKLEAGITINPGVAIVLPAGIEVRTDNSLYDIDVKGTLDAIGASFTGTLTQIDVDSGGRLNIRSGSVVDGNQVRYEPGSLGTVESATFGTARLRLESSAVTVDSCTFWRVDPISTNPSFMPGLFDNTFVNDATVFLSGTATSSAAFQKTANLSKYMVEGNIVINPGVVISLPAGLELRTDNSLYDITVKGILEAVGVDIGGTQTEINVTSGGRLDLKMGTRVNGKEIRYQAESLGSIESSTFDSARLRIESSSVTVNGSSFVRVDPIVINPEFVTELYDNIFVNSATVSLEGTVESDVSIRTMPNLSRYKLEGSVSVNPGVTMAVLNGVEIRTDNSLYDIVIKGTLTVTGATFSGLQTDVIVNSGGRFNLSHGALYGKTLTFNSGSRGAVLQSVLNINLEVHSQSFADIRDNVLMSGSLTARGNRLDSIDFRSNYWNTTDVTMIAFRIRDRNDDARLPVILFEPYLLTPPASFAPEQISISGSSIAENQPSVSTIGSLTAIDRDNPTTVVFSLAGPAGTNDNALFDISGNLLQSRVSFDYEQRSSYTIRVRATDESGLFTEADFVISILDVSEATSVLTPKGSTAILRPLISWTAVSGAMDYDVWIGRAGTSVTFRRFVVTANSYVPTADLEIGRFIVQARARLNAGYGPWSLPMSFEINTPVTVNRLAMLQHGHRPLITWNALPGASQYDVWIADVSRNFSPALRITDATSTSFQPPFDLALGRYRVWVRAMAADGTLGAWSLPQEFIVGPAPVQLNPTKSSFNSRPAFTWSPIAGAVRYELQLRNRTTNVLTAYETQLTGTQWTPAANLSIGDYRWWVIAIGPANTRGAWSSPIDFSIGGKTSLIAPASTVSTGQPEFRWNAVEDAVTYELWVTNLAGTSRVISQSSLTGTTFTSSVMLAKGTYRAWIRAFHTSGVASLWSNELRFTVAAVESSDELLPVTSGLSLLNHFDSRDGMDVLQCPALSQVWATRDVSSENVTLGNSMVNSSASPSQDSGGTFEDQSQVRLPRRIVPEWRENSRVFAVNPEDPVHNSPELFERAWSNLVDEGWVDHGFIWPRLNGV